MRPPPISTLFPYTTLFRSDLQRWPSGRADRQLRVGTQTAVICSSDQMAIGVLRAAENAGLSVPDDFSVVGFDGIRSEEHTSELQSHSDLVCRLLLEKKKRD